MGNKSFLTAFDRAKKAGQAPKTIVVTGKDFMACSSLAVKIEQRLFNQGRVVYYADLDDIKDRLPYQKESGRDADIKRAATAAGLVNEAGVIFITSIPSLGPLEETALRAINKKHTTIVVNTEKPAEHDWSEDDIFDEALKKIQETFDHLNEVLEYYL
jgi:adenylylsulfate kinase-like enzyme